MPAPSPVLISAPLAPRWSRLRRIWKAVGHDLVRLAPVHVDDEAHAARVVLEERVVQALFDRLAGGTPRLGADGFGGRLGGVAEAVVHVGERFDRGAQSIKRAVPVISESGP